MSESWLERVEAACGDMGPKASWADWYTLAREMAVDAEVGRLLRELEAEIAPQESWGYGKWRAGTFTHNGYGDTPLAALQALAEAVKE